jgi:hypothetical protein
MAESKPRNGAVAKAPAPTRSFAFKCAGNERELGRHALAAPAIPCDRDRFRFLASHRDRPKPLTAGHTSEIKLFGISAVDMCARTSFKAAIF